MSKSARARKIFLVTLLILAVIASALTQWFLHLDEKEAVAQQLSEVFVETFSKNETDEPAGSIKWDLMDYGPFFCSSLGGSHNPTSKGISIRIGQTREAAVCFDTERLRMRIGWTGPFLRLPRFRDGLNGEPSPAGKAVFQTLPHPGWAWKNSPAAGNSEAAKKIGHYRGAFTHGKRTILSYTVGKSSILEMPWFTNSSGSPVFSRTFQIDQSDGPTTIHICNVAKAKASSAEGLPVLTQENQTNMTFTVAKVVGAPANFEWKVDADDGISLRLPAFSRSTTFSVFICSGAKSNLSQSIAHLPNAIEVEDLEKLCHGGPLLWNQTIATTGKLGTQKGAYQMDTITLPENNPWNSWLRPSGFDYFADGRAALCSLSGDVWIVSGLNAKLDKLTWKRFATGLFQPLGLKIVDGNIYVMCRDALIRLHDLNGDGEADFYESFNSDIANGGNFHEFCLDLQTDSKGNFYTLKGSNLGVPTTPQQGSLIKISPDGLGIQIMARGFRAPNGLCITPDDEFFATDNEGKWIPACKLNHIETNRFYGFSPTAYTEKIPSGFEPPLFWLPHVLDNSSGAPVWANSTRWGPFKNHLLHTSYGACSLFAVMKEKVNGTWQGGVIKFPLKFDSGIMRGRFNPLDGQLYLCGLGGWQTSATKSGGFYRVRFTGKPANMPCELHVRTNELEIRFTEELEGATAADAENFSVEQWLYKWSEDYGSKDYVTKSPGLLGRDKVDVKSTRLSSDRKSVFLSLPHLKPVMQMKIEYNINAADGSELHQEIYNTINAVPASDTARN